MEHLERQLAEEELNSGEVRELMERLAHEELGGSEMSTLKDVAEATGTPVEVLARMLADIRHVPEIKQRLEVHEERLDQHERHIRTEKSSHRRASYKDYKKFREWELQEESEKAMQGIGIAIVIIVLIAIFMAAAGAFQSPQPRGSSYGGRVSRSVTESGVTYTFTEDPVGTITYTATLPDGTVRPMTQKERDEHAYLSVPRSN